MSPSLACYRYKNSATQGNVATCVEGILEWWAALSQKSKLGFQASIIAEELALNCVAHGKAEKGSLQFSFEIESTPNGLRFAYEDNASEFNPLEKNPCRSVQHNLEKARCGYL